MTQKKPTGILDCDGKEILNGDILLNKLFGDNWIVSNREGVYIVTLVNDTFWTELDDIANFAVIGNVYDN